MQKTVAARQQWHHKSGAVIPLLAICLVPLMGMLAFSIDYGFLRVVKTDLQRSADAACLAAVIDLVPNPDGTQNLDDVSARVREYVQNNMSTATGAISGFVVLAADIEIGRYDENTIYDTGPVTLHQTGIMDAVRVTLRRDGSANGEVPLYFAKVLGIAEKPVTVTATAVLRRGIALKGEGDILPFALPESFWDSLGAGEELNIYNDNKIEDGFGNQVTVLDALGNSVPGNWGTVDIGLEANSTRDLSDQIIQGLDQFDLNALHADGRIPTTTELKAPVTFQAETGLSVGMKDAVRQIHGQTRIIPIYDTINGEFVANSGTGNNAEFHTVKWGVVEVVDSRWNGNRNTWIRSIKAYTYDGALVPKEDLGDKSTDFENAFASPVLVR
ncbi:pilus assembly protein TadG-related protein [Planctomycetaceae bacterium]|jgi:hypothetical protein|nr:pilus assembly protein TadG-related protein [Planctomycetaceae bacterium]